MAHSLCSNVLMGWRRDVSEMYRPLSQELTYVIVTEMTAKWDRLFFFGSLWSGYVGVMHTESQQRLSLIGYCSLKPGRHSEILCQKTKKKARRLGGRGQDRWGEGQEKSAEFDPGLNPRQQSKDPTWPVVTPPHSCEAFKGLGKHRPS